MSSSRALALALFGLGVLTRFAYLTYPREVVFDEYHFGKFINGYITGQYFFDIHPPLGKLLLAAAARAGGYDASQAWSAIGEPIPTRVPLLALRGLPALQGALLPPLLFATARSVGLSRAASLLAGAGALLDVSTLVESRLVLTDPTLLLATAATLLCSARSDYFPPLSRGWVWWTLGSGLAIGCAVSTKWTGLSAMAVAGLHALASLVATVRAAQGSSAASSPPRPLALRLRSAGAETRLRALLQAALPLGIYVGCFALHFWLLPSPGPGVRFHTEAFRAALLPPPLPPPLPTAAAGAAAYAAAALPSAAAALLAAGPLPAAPPAPPARGDVAETRAPPSGIRATPLGFWSRLRELNREMLKANANMALGHSWGSRWWEWPLMRRSVLYWVAKSPHPQPSATPSGIAPVHRASTGTDVATRPGTGQAVEGSAPVAEAGDAPAVAAAGAAASDLPLTSPYTIPGRRAVRIYCIGNPFVWWLSASAVALLSLLSLARALGHASTIPRGEAAPTIPRGEAAPTIPRGEAASTIPRGQAAPPIPRREAASSLEVEAALQPAAAGPLTAPTVPARWLVLLALGYGINWLPFAAVDRVAFLYHFLPALLHGLLLLGVALDLAVPASAPLLSSLAPACAPPSAPIAPPADPFAALALAPGGARWAACALLVCAMACGFGHFAPLAYGTALSHAELDARLWLDSWS